MEGVQVGHWHNMSDSPEIIEHIYHLQTMELMMNQRLTTGTTGTTSHSTNGEIINISQRSLNIYYSLSLGLGRMEFV